MPLDQIMSALAQTRKAFYSEADFQFALAWEIQRALPHVSVRLEYCPTDIDRSMHVDIVVFCDGVGYPIELKYSTLGFDHIVDGERFRLKNQGAQDILRYDFLKDVMRIERLVTADRRYGGGYAILLTNDPSFWKPPTPRLTCDFAFKIHEGAVKSGRMPWAEHTGGTSKGRESAIVLNGAYTLNWRDFSRISDTRWGQFRYLTVKVTKESTKPESLDDTQCNSSPI